MDINEIDGAILDRISLLEHYIKLIKCWVTPNQTRIYAHELEIEYLKKAHIALTTINNLADL